jgi:hypothetical protein
MVQGVGLNYTYTSRNAQHDHLQNIAPPPPPPRGSKNGGVIPPPPPPPSGIANITKIDGVTYNWKPANNGVQTGSDSNGNTYTYNSNDHTLTNESSGQTYDVKTLTAQNGKPLANISYGSETPEGKIHMISSWGRAYTFQRTPGQGNDLGTVTKHRTGQTFQDIKHTNPITGAPHQMTLGPEHMNWNGQVGFDSTLINGHDPWATRLDG